MAVSTSQFNDVDLSSILFESISLDTLKHLVYPTGCILYDDGNLHIVDYFEGIAATDNILVASITLPSEHLLKVSYTIGNASDIDQLLDVPSKYQSCHSITVINGLVQFISDPNESSITWWNIAEEISQMFNIMKQESQSVVVIEILV